MFYGLPHNPWFNPYEFRQPSAARPRWRVMYHAGFPRPPSTFASRRRHSTKSCGQSAPARRNPAQRDLAPRTVSDSTDGVRRGRIDCCRRRGVQSRRAVGQRALPSTISACPSRETRLWTGDVHRHPGRFGLPSGRSGKALGDEGYVDEVFEQNETMQWFLLPILTQTGNDEIVIHPWLRHRDGTLMTAAPEGMPLSTSFPPANSTRTGSGPCQPLPRRGDNSRSPTAPCRNGSWSRPLGRPPEPTCPRRGCRLITTGKARRVEKSLLTTYTAASGRDRIAAVSRQDRAGGRYGGGQLRGGEDGSLLPATDQAV